MVAVDRGERCRLAGLENNPAAVLGPGFDCIAVAGRQDGQFEAIAQREITRRQLRLHDRDVLPLRVGDVEHPDDDDRRRWQPRAAVGEEPAGDAAGGRGEPDGNVGEPAGAAIADKQEDALRGIDPASDFVAEIKELFSYEAHLEALDRDDRVARLEASRLGD